MGRFAESLWYRSLAREGRLGMGKAKLVMSAVRQSANWWISANQKKCLFVLTAEFDGCNFVQPIKRGLTVPLGIRANLP